MKIFEASGATTSPDRLANIELTFGGPVDHVALSGFDNDMLRTNKFHFEKTPDRGQLSPSSYPPDDSGDC